jgi:hypothetical protein
MAVTIQTLNNGDTNYVSKHNTNYQNIKAVLDGLESQTANLIMQGGIELALKSALFGDVTALIGLASYRPNAAGASVSVNAGYVWLYDERKVVGKSIPTSFDMTGKAAGTYYIHVGSDGAPAIDQSNTKTLWAFDWNGTSSISNVVLYAAVTWGNIDWQQAKISDTLGPFDTLDDRLEAIEKALLPAPYDIAATFSGQPASSDVILRYPLPRAVNFPVGLTDSQGVAGVAATDSTPFDIRKNGVSVGAMQFAAGAIVASFTMVSATALAKGDVLTIVAPGTADATLADIGLCLAGERA